MPVQRPILRRFIVAAAWAFMFSVPAIFHSQNSVTNNFACVRIPAGKYIIELAGCGGSLDIYVYDDSFRPVRNVKIKGHAVFYYAGNIERVSLFEQYFLTNFLHAEIPKEGFFSCLISLNIAGDVVTSLFGNECDMRAGDMPLLPQVTSEGSPAAAKKTE